MNSSLFIKIHSVRYSVTALQFEKPDMIRSQFNFIFIYINIYININISISICLLFLNGFKRTVTV